MKHILTMLLLVASVALADTPPPGAVKIKGGTDGTLIGNVGDAGKCSIVNSSIPVTGTFWQATQPVSGNVGRLWSLLNSQDSVTSYQGGAWTVGVSNFPSSFSVSNFPATQPISAASLPLPTNAAQETGGHLASIDTELSTINSTLGSPFQAGGSIGNSSFGISGTLPAFASTPTFNLGTLNGAATAANQATIITALGSPFQAGGSIGNTSFGISGTLPAFASTPTVNLGTIGTAATAANQSTEISSLSTIATNTTGVATAANQTTGNSSLSTIATNTTGVATAANQTTANSTLSTISTNLNNASTGRTSISLMRNAYASVNVTTSAYVQLVASTSDTINYLDVFDSSGQTLALAVGGSGSEVNQFYIVPGGNGPVPLKIPSGSRISVIAISGTASSGELDITGYK